MDFDIKDLENQFIEQTKKITEIEEQIKASYEERIFINEITEYLQKNDLDKEIEKCNKQIIGFDSYYLNGLKNEKSSAIEKLRKLKEYKKYLEENKIDSKDNKDLIQKIKVENIKKTNDFLIQKNNIVKITENLMEICEETVTELNHQNGKSVDLSRLFGEFQAVENEIKSFDIYNNILSAKKQTYLEQLKMRRTKILEQLNDKLPNLGKQIVDSVKQDMYEEEREKVAKTRQENDEKIKQLIDLNKKLQEFDKELRKNKYTELTLKIWEQEKNITRIKMNIPNVEKEIENEKALKPTVKKEIPEYTTKTVGEILKENTQENNEIKEDKKEETLSPEIIAKMNAVVNNIDKKQTANNVETPMEEKTGVATDEDIQKYLFSGEDAINPEYTNKYEEVFEKIKQDKKQQLENKQKENKEEKQFENNIQKKSELENIKKYLKTQKEKTEDEIEKKIKRKTLKEKFNSLGKKVLKKIGDLFLEEVEFEEENTLLEESINEEKGRSK